MTLLEQYQANLEKLELQAAQYGMDVPLALQNNIEYHKQRIQELEQQPQPQQVQHQAVSVTSDIFFEDHFQSNENSWQVGSTTSSQGSFSLEVTNGVYRQTIDSIEPSYCCAAVPEFYGEDFVLEFIATITESRGFINSFPTLTVSIRDSADGAYLIALFEKGYGIGLRSGSNPIKMLVNWTPSGDIPLTRGQHVRFTISVRGTTIMVFANGCRVLVLNDSNIRSSGRITLGVQIMEPKCGVSIEFTDVVIRAAA